MTNKDWFKQAKFGMMIHFGLYALPAGEWKGRQIPFIGEWLQSYFRIPNSEYAQLAKVFHPLLFNAEEWVKLAKGAGMSYMVVTSKHHDGFALFQSEWDHYNVCDGTPFGRDIIGELAEACYKHGLKLGLYYSQDLDWHEPNGGGYTAQGKNCNAMSWTNDWDFPDNDRKNYTELFEGKIKTQMKEILTKYGDLCLIWCDTPQTISKEQSDELYHLIKQYQPDCLVNSRIGNGKGDYASLGDNKLPTEKKTDGLYESPITLNDTWGYKSFDVNWKSAEKVLEIKNFANSHGANCLLNIGPDALGRIPAQAQQVLKELAEKQS